MSPVSKKAAAPKVPTTKTAARKACGDCTPSVPCASHAEAAPDDTRSVKLTIKAKPGLAVFVAGSFNNWDPIGVPLAEKKGVYSATLRLKPGIYEYKFVIDGVWTLDPDPSRDWTQNGLGTLNSLLRVG